MDLGLLYGDFVMDNRELTLHTTTDDSGVFHDDAGLTHCTIRPFRNDDPYIERDPLSTNRRLFRFWRNRTIRMHGGGRSHDGRNLCAGSGLDHLHSGRDMSNRSAACDRTEVGSGRESERHFTTGGFAPVVV